MTLVVGWSGVDTHGTASAYIAADSRISWPGSAKFDFGRKVYAFDNHGDILGYCGDVLFPSIVLGQISEMANCGLLFRTNATGKDKFEAVKEKLIQLFRRYPSDVTQITQNVLQVLHISREPGRYAGFFAHVIEWRRGRNWSGYLIEWPKVSGLLRVMGSGATEFNQNYQNYLSGPTRGTSRSVFHCFCETLATIRDPKCGGAPQLVGLYRKPNSPAVKYGIITQGKRYLFGAMIDNLSEFNCIEWRNEDFELCDGDTMKRRPSAQKQPNPLRQ
jgi:hypothetical protein